MSPRDKEVIGSIGPTTIEIIETLTLHWVYEDDIFITRCDNKAKENDWGTWYQVRKDGKATAWWTGKGRIRNLDETVWKREYWQQSFRGEKDVS